MYTTLIVVLACFAILIVGIIIVANITDMAEKKEHSSNKFAVELIKRKIPKNVPQNKPENPPPEIFVITTNKKSTSVLRGITGTSKLTGITGNVGIKGIVGSTGVLGITGNVGTGFTGSERGYTGYDNVRGATGAVCGCTGSERGCTGSEDAPVCTVLDDKPNFLSSILM